MAKIREYKVVSKMSLQVLVTAVNEALKEGWQPLGSPTANSRSDAEGKVLTVFMQAMIK